jgi:polyribonucleotide nucleotidyltransferase
MKADFKTVEYAPGKTMSVETGRLAKLAHGAVVARIGDTMVLATAVTNSEAKPGQSFFPLSVEFRETYAAGGKFPGGFIKREGRPSEKEILSARLIDRTIRPLFPEWFMNETQIICNVISSDGQNDADVLGAVAASAALHISEAPFDGPMAQVRVGRVNGEYVINPTVAELAESDLNLTVGGKSDSIVMVEGEMKEVSEDDMLEAINLAHESIKKLCAFQEELRKEFGKEKREYEAPVVNEELKADVKSAVGTSFTELAKKQLDKKGNQEAYKEIVTEIVAKLSEKHAENENLEAEVKDFCHALRDEAVREMMLKDKIRMDGRKSDEIRPIWSEVGYLPRTHGSAIFTRGETQTLVTVTLGTKRDEQNVDTLFDTEAKRFMLDYNFPPYCVGEARMMRGVSRREIGHGNLAERALRTQLPSAEEFGYTIRVVSDVLESNGSSSMASVCGGTLALMDAGVPLKKPVAGIAMGLCMGDDGSYMIMSDISGSEDHFGDMDFKVTGTADGITACQMDIKIQGIDSSLMKQAMDQAKAGRQHILDKMAETITESRGALSQYAPSFTRYEVDTDMIGAIIGPGGKVIQGIQKETGTEIMIEEVGNKGIVTIAADNQEKANAALERIKAIAGKPEEGEIYEGTVRSIKEYGAFVEIMPGKDGLLHISEISNDRINRVEDVLREGDKIQVKLVKIESGGKLRLSRKVLLDN